MDRETIIKALETRQREMICAVVDENNRTHFITNADVLALIKELTEENEKLLTALANYDRLTDERIAEEYYTAEAYDELREENERLKKELERSTPKLIINRKKRNNE